MTVELKEPVAGNVLEVKVTGKLEKKDYELFTPVVERLIDEHGKVRILLSTHDFHGWEASALWEDIKFDVKHFNHFERIAIIGEKKWEKGMAMFCKPFTTAKIRYFEHEQEQEARAWLQGAA